VSDWELSEEPSKAEQEGHYEHGGLGLGEEGRVSAADYSEALDEQPPEQPAPLALEASTSEAARVPEPSEAVEGLTIAEAAAAYGLSVSSVRRKLKAGELAGAVKVPGPKGEEYRIPPAALEALGYRPKETRSGAVLTAARASLEAEQLAARVVELEALLEVERIRKQAAEEKAEALAENLSDLRDALARIPLALEAPKRRRWFRSQ